MERYASCVRLRPGYRERYLELHAQVWPEVERAALEARQPMGRLVTADEVAAAIQYLASPAAGSTTGADLAVDGGMSGLRIRPRS